MKSFFKGAMWGVVAALGATLIGLNALQLIGVFLLAFSLEAMGLFSK